MPQLSKRFFEMSGFVDCKVRIDQLSGLSRPQDRDSKLNTFLDTRLNERGVGCRWVGS